MSAVPFGPLSTKNPDASPIRHLTKIELADRWNISPRTLERWRADGGGPASMTIGGSIRYRLADVLAFEAARTKAGTP